MPVGPSSTGPIQPPRDICRRLAANGSPLDDQAAKSKSPKKAKPAKKAPKPPRKAKKSKKSRSKTRRGAK